MESLSVAALRWQCDPQQFAFESTEQVAGLTSIFGQERAVDAIRFGIAIRRQGFNIYALGPQGTGKQTVVEHCLAERTAGEAVPDDWCYVNNFDDLRKPRAIAVPAGRGVRFRDDVDELIEDLTNAIPAALESEEHKARWAEIEHEAAERQNDAFQGLADKAQSQQIQLIRTPGGFVLAPLRDGKVLESEAFDKLPQDEQQRIEDSVSGLQKELQQIVEQVPRWQKEYRDRIKNLNREAVQHAIGHLLSQIKIRYAELPQVLHYLLAMEKDILERVNEFQPAEENPLAALREQQSLGLTLADYQVNLLVDNSNCQGAPVIYEDHPSYHNLIGRVEHESQMGALTTDFTMIKGGALHRANGGYLILDALRLLQQPYAWEGLKRALYARSIRMESLGDMLSLISTVSLEPEPIPLNVKVVLLGDRLFYYLLYAYDPDFAELFKVCADFDDQLQRTPENCQLFAQFVAAAARRDQLRPLTRVAVARVLEHSVRLADDSERLSMHTRSIMDILREADHWAAARQAPLIDGEHIRQAIDSQQKRSDRLRERVHEEIERGTLLIDTTGACVAQVNGLSVLQLADFRFGQPSRITATARLGRGEVVDIEREVELSGPIHSKGVLILSAFLGHRYARRQPLSLSASLVFEQSYGLVDGDSASIAESCALLSALADLPVLQSLAVTGSMNQHGQAQPIGGVNEKIEGFFQVCRTRGLTGDQGVLIPRANVKHLMLQPDVVEAVAAGRFHVYAYETVDEAVSLLTGVPAGTPDATGQYPADSVNGRVAARLAEFTRLRLQFGKDAQEHA